MFLRLVVSLSFMARGEYGLGHLVRFRAALHASVAASDSPTRRFCTNRSLVLVLADGTVATNCN